MSKEVTSTLVIACVFLYVLWLASHLLPQQYQLRSIWQRFRSEPQPVNIYELTVSEYEATHSPPMLNVTKSADEIVNLWGYANPIIEANYHNCSAWHWRVEHIYESQNGQYQHINIPVPKDDTYLTVVVDKAQRKIIGHRIIDLRALYPNWSANDT